MPVAQPDMPVAEQGKAVSVPVAARRLGRSPDAVRSAIRRGKLSASKGNDGDWRVWLPADNGPEAGLLSDSLRPQLDRALAELEQAMRQSADRQATVDELRERVRFLEASAEHAAAHLLKTTERAGQAEGEVRALRDALSDLSRRLDVATAELSEARRPWWRRWFG